MIPSLLLLLPPLPSYLPLTLLPLPLFLPLPLPLHTPLLRLKKGPKLTSPRSHRARHRKTNRVSNGDLESIVSSLHFGTSVIREILLKLMFSAIQIKCFFRSARGRKAFRRPMTIHRLVRVSRALQDGSQDGSIREGRGGTEWCEECIALVLVLVL
jgi:hypothetical protein